MAKRKGSRGRGRAGRRVKRGGGGTAACFKKLSDCGTSPTVANYYCRTGPAKFRDGVKGARARVQEAKAEAVRAAAAAVSVAQKFAKNTNSAFKKFKKARAQVLSSCAK